MSAHAANAIPENPWIVICLPEFGKADQASEALVLPARYATVAECFHDKGRVEQYLLDHYPRDRYVVWCAQVPGLELPGAGARH